MSSIVLPEIPKLRAIVQSLAMLDAILCPQWHDRYYSYNRRWAPAEEMASMRDGSGNNWFLLFDSVGAALKGCAHELADGPSFSVDLQLQVPNDFSSFLSEPAFSMHFATFCFWRRAEDKAWNKVQGFGGDDGSDELLSLIIAGPDGYKEWAGRYFEMDVDGRAVRAVFDHLPLSDSIISMLNPGARLELVRGDADEIGYPQ